MTVEKLERMETKLLRRIDQLKIRTAQVMMQKEQLKKALVGENNVPRRLA